MIINVVNTPYKHGYGIQSVSNIISIRMTYNAEQMSNMNNKFTYKIRNNKIIRYTGIT